MSQPKKFGTFGGVFTPSILTILGVIMYLRMGWVVGNAGLWGTVLIILVAHVISVSTGLSVSSIATDKKVGAGGVYYVLSRSLGLPIGGALGMTLFVATAMSIALYMVGFAEILNQVLGYGFEEVNGELKPAEGFTNAVRISATIGLIGLTVIAFISTSIAIKTQFIIFGLIILSLVSIFFGSGSLATPLAEGAVVADSAGFAEVFAVFFPAVTGFTAGVAMSGDLKDPKKSIPYGTMIAIATGLVIYLGLALFIYFSSDGDLQLLRGNDNYLFQVALIGSFVLLGVWGATLSSALGGILGGPRILQAMSVDQITPKVFAKGVGADNEPRNALILTVIIAEAGILIGELNVIAEVVSMFYLAAYGFINLSFFLESWASSDFNPTFRVNKWTGLVGFGATMIIMSQLNLGAMVAAFIIISGIYLYLSRKQVALGTGDIWQSVWATVVKKGLRKMEAGSDHKRNWKPNTLLFSVGITHRSKLIEFSKAVSGQTGIITNFDLHENEHASVLFPKSKEIVTDEELEKYGIFGRKLEVQNIFKGIESIACTFGFSGIEPNTVLMGWPGKTKDPIWFTQMTQKLIDLDYNVLYLDYDERWGFRKKSKIDLWWSGSNNNAELMLLLAKFITSSPEWSQATIRVILVSDTNQDYKIIESRVQYVLDQFRVKAEIKVINNAVDRKAQYELMKVHSAEADLVFVGIPEIEEDEVSSFVERTNNLVGVIGTTLLVKASSQFDETDLKIEHISLQHETKKIEEAELIPLSDCKDVAFDETLKELDQSLKELADAFVTNAIQSVESYHNQIFSKVTDRMDNFFVQIAESDNSEEQEMRLHNVLAEVKDIYADALENQLPVIEERFNQETTIYLNAKEKLFGYLPNRAKVQSVATGDGDTKKANRKVRYRYAVQRMWLSEGLKETYHQFLEFGYENLLLVHRSKNILHDRIWEFLAAADDHTNIRDAASSCRNQLDIALEEVRSEALNLAANFFKNLRNNERENLNDLSELVLRTDYKQELLKRYPIQTNKELIAERKGVLNYPGFWFKNLILFTYHLEADLYLIQYSAHLQQLANELKEHIKEHYFDKLEQNETNLETQLANLQKLIDQQDTDKICQTNIMLSEDIFFNASYVLNQLMDEQSKMLNMLPEEIELMTASSINNIREAQGAEVVTEKLALKDFTDYLVNTNFIDPMHIAVQTFFDALKRSSGKLINATLLVQNAIDTFALNEKYAVLSDALQTAKEEFSQAKKDADIAIQAFLTELKDRKELIRNELDVNLLVEQAESLTQYVKKQKRKNVLAESYERLNKSVSQKMNKAMDYFIKRKRDISSSNYKTNYSHLISEQGRISDFIDQVSQKTDLPFYYQQLFVGTHYAESRIEENRAEEIRQAKSAIKRIDEGSPGAIMILGTSASGKTYFTNYVAGQLLSGKVYQLTPVMNKTWGPQDLTKSFQRATGIQESVLKILGKVPKNSVFVLQDLEQWWLKKEGGDVVMEDLAKIIQKYGAKHYFILNANLNAYELISRNTSIHSRCLRSIILPPMSSVQVRDVIWTRHQTGGMQIVINGTNEKHLSHNKINKFISKYHATSGGVIGLACQQWIASVHRHDENELFMEAPSKKEFPELDNAEWRNLIYQLFIHHNLNRKELYDIYGAEHQRWINRTLDGLRASGLLRLNERDAYYIRKEARPYVENWLSEAGYFK